jgi:hypothetical protein
MKPTESSHVGALFEKLMHLDQYVHPEFGWLSPTRRFRRGLRTSFLSGLIGIGIGAAAMIALYGYANAPDDPDSRGVSSRDLPQPMAEYNAAQTTKIEIDSKPNGAIAEANSQTSAAPNARTKNKRITSCGDHDLPCPAARLNTAMPPEMRIPTANNTLPIGQIPLGQSEEAAGPIAATPLERSQKALEDKNAGRSEWRNPDDAGGESDRPDTNRLSYLKLHKTARIRNPSQQRTLDQNRAVHRFERYDDRGRGEVGRALAHDSSYGQKGFWAWSR